jgi:ribosomal protein L37AE/L43A
MRNVHHTNGKGLPNYPDPDSIEMKDVNVYVHDSGMCATHDYFCPVCSTKSAVLDLSTGIMQPCNECAKTYTRIEKKKTFWQRVFS